MLLKQIGKVSHKISVKASTIVCSFVGFVVLRPSQHIKVMSSVVGYPIHTVPGQAS